VTHDSLRYINILTYLQRLVTVAFQLPRKFAFALRKVTRKYTEKKRSDERNMNGHRVELEDNVGRS